MKRLLRWFIYVVLFLVFLIAVAYTTGQIYKPRLLAKLNEQLNQNIHGDIEIGDLDFTFFEQFPAISITLSDVYLRGPQYKVYKHDFFSAEKIYVHARLGRLLVGQINLKSISIKQANITIFRTKDGYTNLDVFKTGKPKQKKKEGEGGGLEFVLGELRLVNTKVQYSDSVKGKGYGATFADVITRVTPTDSSRQISLAGNMIFDGLLLNPAKGSYLQEKQTLAHLNLEFMPARKVLNVMPSSLQFEKSLVNLNGVFNLGPASRFQLDVQSGNLDYTEGLTIVTQALAAKLNKFNFSKPLVFHLKLDGSLSGGEPKIDIGFSTRDNDLNLGKINMNSLTMEGTFMNHIDSTRENGDPNSRLQLNPFSAVISGISTTGTISLIDLKNPHAVINTKGKLNLTDLNSHSDPDKLLFTSGTFTSEIQFDGLLSEYLNDTTSTFTGKLKGNAHIKDGALQMKTLDKRIGKANVDISFTQDRMDLSGVAFDLNGNYVDLHGDITGFVPFFFQPKQKGRVTLVVNSSRLDLEKLVKKKRNETKKPKGEGKKKISHLIEVLYSKVEFDIDVKVKEMVNGPMVANDVHARFVMEKGHFEAKPMEFKLAGGTVSMNLRMEDLDKPISGFSVSSKIQKADISRLMKSFKNFNQKSIGAENLSGTISMDARLAGKVDDQFNLLMPAISGKIELKIRNGNLKDCEPLMKMSNFLMKKRDFSDVKFAEINSRFTLSGSNMNISRMEIQSSILTLFIEGTYSLGKDTDLSIQVPLSNLKKRDKNYKPQNVGPDAKVGASVFLRARPNKEGQISLAYDPLKKMRKK